MGREREPIQSSNAESTAVTRTASICTPRKRGTFCSRMRVSSRSSSAGSKRAEIQSFGPVSWSSGIAGRVVRRLRQPVVQLLLRHAARPGPLGQALGPLAGRGGLARHGDGLAGLELAVGGVQVVEQDLPGVDVRRSCSAPSCGGSAPCLARSRRGPCAPGSPRSSGSSSPGGGRRGPWCAIPLVLGKGGEVDAQHVDRRAGRIGDEVRISRPSPTTRTRRLSWWSMTCSIARSNRWTSRSPSLGSNSMPMVWKSGFGCRAPGSGAAPASRAAGR